MELYEQHALILSHKGFVEQLAKGKERKVFSPQIRLEDLVSAGLLGLVQAAHKYDRDKGDFKVYAKKWILGRMSNYIQETLMFRQWQSKRPMISLNELEDYNDSSLIYEDELEDGFEELIHCLPPRERQVMRWYYADELTCKEIGEKLFVNESRVSQIIAGCQKAVRDSLLC